MKIGTKALSAIITIVIIMLFPIKYGDVLTENYLERQIINTDYVTLIPMQEINEKATAAEIWIEQIQINNQKYDINNLQLSTGWQVLDGKVYCADAREAQPLIIDLPQKCYYSISFLMTEASGILQYSVGDSKDIIDLYCKERKSRSVLPEEIWGRVTEATRLERGIYYVAYTILFWLLIDTAISFLFNRNKKRYEVINSLSKSNLEN